MARTSNFITLKDHKKTFNSNSTVRLINLAEHKFCRISKAIFDTENKNKRETMNLNQWRSTQIVTDWSKDIRSNHLRKFVILDIKEFYPSFTENLQKNPEFLLKHRHFFHMTIKQLFVTQGNHYSLTNSKLELKETVGYLMSWLGHGNKTRRKINHFI